ncbi:hypothetical protein VTI74DRAFT_10744 [Chaetomium olivicolor]
MDRTEFERIEVKAKQQLDHQNDPAACDIEAMALQVAWLNRRYREESVYFALLDVPDMDIAAFPPCNVGESFLFYRHHDGIWSAAHITRQEAGDEVLMFDGISSLAPAGHDEEWCIRDDEERNARIGRLTAAIETWLNGMRRCINIPFWDSGDFSDRDSTLSGTLCLAWAEGRFNKRPMCLTWQEDRMEAAWVPTTNDPDKANMSEDGDGVCHWKHVLCLRAHRARVEDLGTT